MRNLDELLKRRTRGDRGDSPERKKEKQRRATSAQHMAQVALVGLHKSDYDDLYQQAKAKIAAERGPLPE